MNVVMWIGTAVTAAMFIPQAWTTYKAKSVGDLSIVSYSIVLFGTSIWSLWGALGTSHGVEWGAWIANSAILIVCSPIVWFLYRKINPIIPYVLYAIFAAIIAGGIAMVASRETLNPFMEENTGKTLSTISSIICGAGTGFAFAPQTWKLVRTKSFVGVSMQSTSLLIACNLIWTFYYMTKLIYMSQGTDSNPDHNMELSSALLAFLPASLYSAISSAIHITVMTSYLKNNKKVKVAA